MNAKDRKWFIRAYIPIDPEDMTGMDLESAIKELEQVRMMQAENIYELVSADEEQEPLLNVVGHPINMSLTNRDYIYHERQFLVNDWTPIK